MNTKMHMVSQPIQVALLLKECQVDLADLVGVISEYIFECLGVRLVDSDEIGLQIEIYRFLLEGSL